MPKKEEGVQPDIVYDIQEFPKQEIVYVEEGSGLYFPFSFLLPNGQVFDTAWEIEDIIKRDDKEIVFKGRDLLNKRVLCVLQKNSGFFCYIV